MGGLYAYMLFVYVHEAFAMLINFLYQLSELHIRHILDSHLRNECLFSWFMGNESYAVLVRFVCSALRFIPHEPRKKALISYIYNASNKDPFNNSPRKVINSKFPQ